jgi:hypothetical protein
MLANFQLHIAILSIDLCQIKNSRVASEREAILFRHGFFGMDEWSVFGEAFNFFPMGLV